MKLMAWKYVSPMDEQSKERRKKNLYRVFAVWTVIWVEVGKIEERGKVNKTMREERGREGGAGKWNY